MAKKRKRVKPRSEKRKAELERYLWWRVRFLNRHRICQCIKPDGRKCHRPATQVHHRKGRGKYYLALATWMAVCEECHELIESERAWAYEHGYLLRRCIGGPIPPLPTPNTK